MWFFLLIFRILGFTWIHIAKLPFSAAIMSLLAHRLMADLFLTSIILANFLIVLFGTGLRGNCNCNEICLKNVFPAYDFFQLCCQDLEEVRVFVVLEYSRFLQRVWIIIVFWFFPKRNLNFDPMESPYSDDIFVIWHIYSGVNIWFLSNFIFQANQVKFFKFTQIDSFVIWDFICLISLCLTIASTILVYRPLYLSVIL
jgi:hypothetical protein